MKKLSSLTFVVTIFVSAAWIYCAPPEKPAQSANPATSENAADDEKPSTTAETDDSSPSSTPGVTPPSLPAAVEKMKQARDRLVEYNSFRAQIVETVAFGPRKFKVTGNYLHGPQLKLRLDYQVQIGSSEGSLLEVCDGQVLWTRYRIGKEDIAPEKNVRITRRDVGQILKAAASSPNAADNMLIADLGLGGLPSLLASIERNVRFESLEDKEVDGHALHVLEGGWDDDYLKLWSRDGQLETAQIPPYVPDRVRVYLDQQTLFPRRILYLKKPAERNFYRPVVTLDFKQIELNVAVNDDDFHFVPPDGVFQTDVTKQYLQQLAPAQPPAQDKTE